MQKIINNGTNVYKFFISKSGYLCSTRRHYNVYIGLLKSVMHTYSSSHIHAYLFNELCCNLTI